jgi:hypothetical protein
VSSRRKAHCPSRAELQARADNPLPEGIWEVPEGFEEIPDFRRKDRHYNLKVTRELQASRREAAELQSLTDPRRLAWWNDKMERQGMAKVTAIADWHDAARRARKVLADMEKSKLFTDPELLQVIGSVATLEDLAATVSDKRQALRTIGEMFDVFGRKRAEANLLEKEKEEVAKGELERVRSAEAAVVDDLTGHSTLSLLERLPKQDDAASTG